MAETKLKTTRPKLKTIGTDLQKMIDTVKPEVQPMVDRIEKGYKLTQNHYGAYMTLIGQLADMEKKSTAKPLGYRFWGCVLMDCGANVRGVKDALNILIPDQNY